MNSELRNNTSTLRLAPSLDPLASSGLGTSLAQGSGTAEPIYCDHCHKEIEGIYMFAMGGVFCCNACVETYVREREVGTLFS